MRHTKHFAALRSSGLAISLLLAIAGCAGSTGSTADAPCDECGPAVPPPDPAGAVVTDAPRLDVAIVDSGPGLSASLAATTVRVRPGSSTTLEVRVDRSAFEGEVAVWAEGLPSGVLAAPAVMPGAVPTGRLLIEATEAAALGGPFDFQVVVSATEVEPIEVSARLVVAGAPGSFDQTFGEGGVAGVAGGSYGVNAVAVDTHGRVLVAGKNWDTRAMLLERLGADGHYDAAYGQNARVILPDTEPSSAGRMVLDGDGARVLVVGGSDSGDRVQVGLAAFDELGHPDVSVGGDGTIAVTQIGVDEDGSWALTEGDGSIFFRVGDRMASLRPDGRVTEIAVPEDTATSYAMGYWNHTLTFAAAGGDASSVVERVHTAGGRDARFAEGGILRSAKPTAEDHEGSRTVDIALLEDGSGYAARIHTFVDGASYGELVRFTSDGHLDATFGAGGSVSLQSEGERIEALVVDAVGRPVLYTEQRPTFERRVRRYTTSGQLDRAFGDGGVVSLDELGRVRRVAHDAAADRLVACGAMEDGTGWQCGRLWL